MPQVTLRYTLWTKTDSLTLERGAEFDVLPVAGDQIDAFSPAVEPFNVVKLETDPDSGRIVVTLEHWGPDLPEHRRVSWDDAFTRDDLSALAEIRRGEQLNRRIPKLTCQRRRDGTSRH
jgi:hypothetical protein